MDRRSFKNFITKRSSIWTLSLCMTGAIVLGGIAAVNNARNTGEEITQVESEINEFAFLEEDSAEGEQYTAGQEGQTEGAAEASGSAVEETAAVQEEQNQVDADANESTDGAASEAVSTADSAVTAEDGDAVAADAVSEAASDTVISEQALLDAGVAFSEEGALMWPSAGTILIDYSMDSSVYFPTLNQYKYNPALIIRSDVGNQVIASAKGIVESVSIDEETGNTLVLNIGNGYKLTYGQLKELAVAEGDVVEEGSLLGYVSEPTKYYSEEGSNLYFAMTQNEKAVDPVLYLD